jgi:hypothetical protein
MTDINQCKLRFIHDLWLPVVKKSTKYFFPKKRSNFEMSLFTLTADTNFEEITYLSNEKLIQTSKTVVWTYASQKRWRLEPDLPDSTIVGLAKYENSISDGGFDIEELFPFNIINLDFSSQDPEYEQGRLEKEIHSLEKTISVQQRKDGDCVLIFTTILNGNNLNFNLVCTNSDSIHSNGWSGLNNGNHSIVSIIQKNEEKIEALKYILCRMFEKYRYRLEYTLKKQKMDDHKVALSIACIIRRSH